MQVCLFLTRDFFYFFASETSPQLVMLHNFCGFCNGREEDCATQSGLLILVPSHAFLQCLSICLGLPAEYLSDVKKMSSFMLDVTNLPESTNPHMHRT